MTSKQTSNSTDTDMANTGSRWSERWDEDTRRRVLACLVCGLLAAAMWWVPVIGGFMREQERELGDFFTGNDMRLQPREDFVFLGIDAASLSLDGVDPEVIAKNATLQKMRKRMPWDRRVYADAIDRLANAGAKLIIIDVLFVQAASEQEDDALAAAISRHPGKVVLASKFVVQAENSGNTMSQVVEPSEVFLGPLDNETPVGFVNYEPHHEDRVLREILFTKTLNEANNEPRHPDEYVFHSLAAMAAKQLGEVPPASGNRGRFRMARLEGENVDEVYKPESLYKIFVANDWREIYQDGAYFQNKVVMIGPADPTFQDAHDTPAGKIYGAQIHLHALGAILDDAWYHEILLDEGWVLPVILCASALLVSCLIVLGWSRTGVLSVALLGIVVAWFGGVYLINYTSNLVVAAVPWVATASSGIFGSIIWQAMTERARRQQLHRHLQRSMSPDVADAIVKAPAGYYAAASGNRKQVTVLFTDVRGFTERSERQDAVQLVSQLNEYLAKMVEVIFAHGGTVDKFIGDAIMVTWGGLGDKSKQDHAINAVQASVNMLEALAELNRKWSAAGLEPFKVGVGLHHGEAIVGEVGSDQRTDFTVIGDAVNLASRIEGLTKMMGVDLLISSAVVELLPESPNWVNVGSVRVKGRDGAVSLYSYLESGNQRVIFEKALTAFQQGDFADATAAFTELDAIGPLAGLAAFYRQQLKKIAVSGDTKTPSGWDGVIKMDSK